MRSYAKPYCKHVCHLGDPTVPCCSTLPQVHSIGPYVQPTLFENWITGAFEFAASNQLLVVAGKSVILAGLVGIMLLIWGYMGEHMGVMELPRARFINPAVEFDEEERILLDIIDGNWLATLENHVMHNEKFQDKTNFLCCVFRQEDQKKDSLECFPHLTRTIHSQPNFRCKSKLKYDISLNLKALKPVEQTL